MILGLGAQKAFDLVHWGYLHKVLAELNFDNIFVRRIRADI